MKKSRLGFGFGFLPLGLIAVLTLGSCKGGPGDGGSGAPAASAEARFQALEKRLLEAETVHIRGGAGSNGAVTSTLEGKAILASGNRAHIEFAGDFGSTSVFLALVSDGEKLWGGNGTKNFEAETPPSLNEGIILGLTRMGILHNLAVLSGPAPPEGTDGTIRDWLTATNFAWGEPETLDGVSTETITFDIVVRGEPSAKAMLWLNRETGLPVQRQQTVRFPDGEMMAVEVYETVEIDAPFESGEFVVP
jgi:hypothetical protein